jgi:hypothetical protein
MKRFTQSIFLALFALAAFGACVEVDKADRKPPCDTSRGGTDVGNPRCMDSDGDGIPDSEDEDSEEDGSSSLVSPSADPLVAVCGRIHQCRPQADAWACGLAGGSAIEGLSRSSAAADCRRAIDSISCLADEMNEAWSASSPDDFTGIRSLEALLPESCFDR